jgi:cell division transport system permease protein
MRPAWCCMKAGCMSMIDAVMQRGQRSEPDTGELPSQVLPKNVSSIVPRKSVAGHALVAVIAIMTFLASLTTGAVMLVSASARDWQTELAREVTIQIRPASERDIEADLRKAAEIARAAAGVNDVRPYSKEESARLLEPWLGSGLNVDDLPVPRLIVVRVATDRPADLAALSRTLSDQIPGATLDDHRGWIDRMRAMARTVTVIGLGVLALVLAATILAVMFATRGAMATNRPIVEVLHFVGAKDSFIAAQFQRHFLMIGLQGGVIGGGAAILLFALAGLLSDWQRGSLGAEQAAVLFGMFSLGLPGYVALGAQIILVAAVTAITSRYTVSRTLEALD